MLSKTLQEIFQEFPGNSRYFSQEFFKKNHPRILPVIFPGLLTMVYPGIFRDSSKQASNEISRKISKILLRIPPSTITEIQLEIPNHFTRN